MANLQQLIKQASDKIESLKGISKRDLVLDVFNNYMPKDTDGMHPIYDDEDFPEDSDSCLWVNISHNGIDIKVQVTDTSDRKIPLNEPMRLTVLLDGKVIAVAEETRPRIKDN